MRDIALRAHKDRLMEPVAQRLFSGIHPNILSFVALFFGLLSAYAVVRHAFLMGLALWIANRVLDGLDGLVARTHQKQSDFGGYLDLLLDFVVYLAVPIAFVAAEPTMLNLWAGVFLLSVYVINTLSWTSLSALLEKRRQHSRFRQTSMEMPVGLIEGTETILFYALFYLAPEFVGYTFIIMGGLVLFTAGQRVVWACHNLR